jgi:Xaa-Pro aminopeptidase
MHGFEQLTLAPLDRKLIDVEMLTADEQAYVDAYHAEVLGKVGPLLDGEVLDWLKVQAAPL